MKLEGPGPRRPRLPSAVAAEAMGVRSAWGGRVRRPRVPGRPRRSPAPQRRASGRAGAAPRGFINGGGTHWNAVPAPGRRAGRPGPAGRLCGSGHPPDGEPPPRKRALYSRKGRAGHRPQLPGPRDSRRTSPALGHLRQSGRSPHSPAWNRGGGRGTLQRSPWSKVTARVTRPPRGFWLRGGRQFPPRPPSFREGTERVTGKLTFALQDGACRCDAKWKSGPGKRCHRPHGHRVTHAAPGSPAAAAHFLFARPRDDSAQTLESRVPVARLCPPGGRWPRASGSARRGSAQLCPLVASWPLHFKCANKAVSDLNRQCLAPKLGGTSLRGEGRTSKAHGEGDRTPTRR